MAYTSTSLTMIGQRVGAAPAIWVYDSTADAIGTIVGTEIFTDAAARGVAKRDICFSLDGGSTVFAVGMFTTVTASSYGTLTVGNLSSTI